MVHYNNNNSDFYKQFHLSQLENFDALSKKSENRGFVPLFICWQYFK